MLGKRLLTTLLETIRNRKRNSGIEVDAQSTSTEASLYRHNTFSQAGEDVIIDFVSRQCEINITDYFDIGASHPFEFSNTALFYFRGASGVCVEPIPSMAEAFKVARKRDTVINNVVSSAADPVDFFIIEPSTLSTLEPEALKRALKTPGATLIETIKVNSTSLDQLFEHHGVPQLLCIDVEGGDMEVLQTWNMEKYRPKLLCVEDLEYSAERKEKRSIGVTDLLVENGYMLFANTFINSILIDKNLWIES